MKKKIIIPLVLATIVGSTVIGVSANSEKTANMNKQTNSSSVSSVITSNESNENIPTNEVAPTNIISKEEAKKIAFEHARVTENDITKLKVTKDTEDGVLVYEVEFNVGTKEYDYEIHAQNGNIISFDVDYNEDKNSNTITSNESNENIPSNEVAPSNMISKEEAKKIALAKVPGATDSHIRIHLEREDGKYVYEGTLQYENKEYDFEIDAQSGTVNEWEVEVVDVD